MGRPREYELVVLGTPVWAGTIASPMRSFLFRHGRHLRKVACFCTTGGRRASSALAEMISFCAAPAEVTFSATSADIRHGRHRDELGKFIAAIEDLAGLTVSAVA